MASSVVPPRVDGDGSYALAVTTTVAPSAARRCAIARPIPRLLPVTSATRPSSRAVIE